MEHFGFEDIVHYYSSRKQLRCYTNRVKLGLLMSEKALIKKYFKNDKDKPFLDIGTGCGRFAINAYEEGYTDMYGIDINPLFIERAIELAKKRRFNINFSVQNAISTEFPENTFKNAIFSYDGFAQIPGEDNRFKGLSEIFRITKRDGIFILTIPDIELLKRNCKDFWDFAQKFINSDRWKRCGYYSINDVPLEDGGYINLTSVERMREMVQDAGFTIVDHMDEYHLTNGITDQISPMESHFFILKKENKHRII